MSNTLVPNIYSRAYRLEENVSDSKIENCGFLWSFMIYYCLRNMAHMHFLRFCLV